MNILLTNDDGIYAPGIRVLYDELKKDHQVSVIAPESEQSAVGHAITLLRPLRIKAIRLGEGFEGFAVDGTPADCVKIGVQHILSVRPDIILSGINLGPNTGIDALYSGTVSAATEGAILGIPSIAISLGIYKNADFNPSARIARLLVDVVLKKGLKRGTALSVNVPPLPFEKLTGFEITRHGQSRFLEKFDARTDPRGNTYYWQTGDIFIEDEGYDTDHQALSRGRVSITPIHCDLTDYGALSEIRSWKLDEPMP